ncbi:MAG: metallophosphoesterase [Planctomycetota bacterium]
MSGRRIFIGDVQGCREELETLLEKLRFDPSGDEVHPVGDFVNRGPDSAGVLRLCREIDAGGVLGNHDLHALRRWRGESKSKRRDTLNKLLAAKDADELMTWLSARPFVRAWRKTICVHAGFHPRWDDPVKLLEGRDSASEDEVTQFAVSVRHCTKDGERPSTDWPPPGAPYRAWYEFWSESSDHKETVVYGHWSQAGKVREKKVRGLDTGCVWGGKLTAWIEQEDRFVSVDARSAHAPIS